MRSGERVASPAVVAAGSQVAILEAGDKIGLETPPGGNESKKESADEGEDETENEYVPVDADVEIEGEIRGRADGAEGGGAAKGEEDANKGPAERETDGDFPGPGAAPRQQQVGHVYTSDEEDKESYRLHGSEKDGIWRGLVNTELNLCADARAAIAIHIRVGGLQVVGESYDFGIGRGVSDVGMKAAANRKGTGVAGPGMAWTGVGANAGNIIMGT